MTTQVEGPAPPGDRSEDQAAAKLLDGAIVSRAIDLDLVAAHLAGHLADQLDHDHTWRPDSAWIADILTRPRCRDCRYPLSAASSIAAGRGWRCQANRGER